MTFAKNGTRTDVKKVSMATVGFTSIGIGKIVSARQRGNNIHTNGMTNRFVTIPQAGTPPLKRARSGNVVSHGAATRASHLDVCPNRGETIP
jgi:hypothetical protein